MKRIAQGRLARLFVAAGILLLVAAAGAHAAVIRSPVSATASSQFSADFAIGNIIDQSGLGVGFTSGVDDFDDYLALDPTHAFESVGNEWFSQMGDTSATLTFDLGGVFRIDRMALWNEEFSGIGAFDLALSEDGASFTTVASGWMPADNPPAMAYAAEVFGLTPASARFVRLDVSGCPQPSGGAEPLCGLGEIAFSTRVVPEPGAAGLVALGLGILAVRRRAAGASSR